MVQLQGRFRSLHHSAGRGGSAKLQKFSGQLQDIENHLPIDPKYRNPKIGALSPIVVVDEIFCAGDANQASKPRRLICLTTNGSRKRKARSA